MDPLQGDADDEVVPEVTPIDLDGDDAIDGYQVVDPATGNELLVADRDLDGTIDAAVLDLRGDGTIDRVMTDRDGDGVWEQSFDPAEGGAWEGQPQRPEPEPLEDPFSTGDGDGDRRDGVHGEPMTEARYHQAQPGPVVCVPTSVAMVLTEATGQAVAAEAVVAAATELGVLGADGMTIDGGRRLLEHLGVEATAGTGSVDDLRELLDDGAPVIIGLDADDLYGRGDDPFADDLVTGHAVVLTGIDDEAGVVYVNDPGFPDGAGVAISIAEFADAWHDAGNSMLVAEQLERDVALLPFQLRV